MKQKKENLFVDLRFSIEELGVLIDELDALFEYSHGKHNNIRRKIAALFIERLNVEKENYLRPQAINWMPARQSDCVVHCQAIDCLLNKLEKWR